MFRTRCLTLLLALLVLALPLRTWAAWAPGACHQAPAAAVVLLAAADQAPAADALHGAAHDQGQHEHGHDDQSAADADHAGSGQHHSSPCCLALAPPQHGPVSHADSPRAAAPVTTARACAPAVWPVQERPPRG